MLPNWLYGKSKSKLATILGGGGTPEDYNQVKAQVTQNAEDITALLDNTEVNGAINELDHTGVTDTSGTVKFTVNEDKSITVSANSYPVTLGSTTTFFFFGTNSTAVPNIFKGKKFTGCPSGGTSGTYKITIQEFSSATPSGAVAESSDVGEGANISNGDYIRMYIRLANGYQLTSALTFHPMITVPSYNGPYVPYAKSNRELTEKLTSDTNLGTAVDLSTYTAYSNMFTAPSDGYVHFQSDASGSQTRTIYTYGNNTTAAADPHFTHSTSANNKAFEIYVRKGLKIYADGLQSGDTINFYTLL